MAGYSRFTRFLPQPSPLPGSSQRQTALQCVERLISELLRFLEDVLCEATTSQLVRMWKRPSSILLCKEQRNIHYARLSNPSTSFLILHHNGYHSQSCQRDDQLHIPRSPSLNFGLSSSSNPPPIPLLPDAGYSANYYRRRVEAGQNERFRTPRLLCT